MFELKQTRGDLSTFVVLMRALTIVIAFLVTIHLSSGQIRYFERAHALGVNEKLDIWTIGTGISTYDFNQDGRDDLTLGTEEGRPLAFYINNGNGFDWISPLVNHQETAKQVLWADYDNDGDPDLFVATFDGISKLYRNDGELNLIDVTEETGLKTEIRRAYGAAWGDVNRDGWLDLYVNARDLPGAPEFENVNWLYMSNADGTFTEGGSQMFADDRGKIPFSSSFLDYNNDMWPDIYTAHDRFKGNTLLENVQGKMFMDVSDATGAGVAMNAMCVNFADLNRDGWLDIYVTNTAEGNVMLINDYQDKAQGIIRFVDRAEDLGISFNSIGWGSNFLDADNDGDLDLYVSGQVEGTSAPSSLFYENTGISGFTIVSDGDFKKDTVPSFANAIADWNNDGHMDIVVQNNPPFAFHLWQNQTISPGNWLALTLEGVLSNRDGIGSRIEIYYEDQFQMSYTHCGFGFLGQNSRKVHFGTGSYSTIDSLKITWPSGHIDRFTSLNANTTYHLIEGESTGGEITTAEGVHIRNRSTAVSTNELIDGKRILIYPNPVSFQLYIEAEESFTSVHIIDLSGRKVFELIDMNAQSLRVGIAHWQPGTYITILQFDEGVWVGKFIKP